MRLALLLAAALFATQALAQQDAQRQYQPTQPGAQIDVDRDRGVSVDVRTGERRADTDRRAAHSKTIRVSELTGTTVRNEADENLGSIHDVVIDLESGCVNYVAISVGGVLGVGAKYFAVPLDALERRTAEDNTKIVIWNVDQQTLDNAEGFDNENWPDRPANQLGARQARSQDRTQYDTGERQAQRPIQEQDQPEQQREQREERPLQPTPIPQ